MRPAIISSRPNLSGGAREPLQANLLLALDTRRMCVVSLHPDVRLIFVICCVLVPLAALAIADVWGKQVQQQQPHT